MSDLIDRGDVLGVISCFFEDSFIEDSDVHCAELEWEINGIPAAPRWVRCEDSVPEPHKNALFCGKKGGMFVGWTYGYGEDGVFRAFVHGGNARTVTHWMPLPEPPREE